MTYDTLTIDELRAGIRQRDEQLRMAIDENKRLKHEHVTDMVKADLERDQLKQQLVQAQAVATELYKCATSDSSCDQWNTAYSHYEQLHENN